MQINVTANNANLWIENLNITNSGSAIRFGSGLNIIGNGTITISNIGAAIGTDVWQKSNSNINIGGSVTVNATSTYGAGIGLGSGGYCSVGTITQNVENIETNLPTLTEPTEPTLKTVTETVEVETTINVAETVTETVEIPASFASNFVFHRGEKAGQSLNISIGDMHTKSLKGKVPSEADNERLLNLQNDADKYNAFQELLDEVQNLTLDDINLRTRENANIAIRLVDGALDYALDQATNIGAYLQRLEYTLENVTITSENTQAAESTIRDVDMAREMSNYAKANVLSQAAQSVLAQANQNGDNVLNLLR